MLLDWAHGKASQAGGGLEDPNFLVPCLLQGFENLRIEPDAIDDLSPDCAQRFAGVPGVSYHAVAWSIGQKILTEAAKSFGGLFFTGLDPAIGLSRASITALGQVDLRKTDFGQRLKAIQQFDPFELSVLLDKEAAKTRAIWRERSEARPESDPNDR